MKIGDPVARDKEKGLRVSKKNIIGYIIRVNKKSVVISYGKHRPIGLIRI